MGNVSSRPEEGAAIVLRDQSRRKLLMLFNLRWPFLLTCCLLVSVASLTVTNSRQKTLLNATPNIYPASRIIARKDTADDGLVEYIQVGTPINRKA